MLLVAWTLAGCQCDEPLADLIPVMVVSPGTLDLGTVRTATRIDDTIQVGNRGSGTLSIQEIRLDPDDAGFSLLGELPTQLSPGEAVDVAVAFLGPAPGDYAATLTFASNDPETPVIVVPLTAVAGTAALSIRPNPVNLGRVNQGPGQRQALTLENVGFDGLGITSATFLNDVGYVLDGSFPLSLQPGEQQVVTVSLNPDATIAANRDDDGVLRDTLRFSGTVDDVDVPITATINLAPIAVAVEEQSRRTRVKVGIGTPIAVDGSETTDPEGDDFSFIWSVAERPTDSAAVIIGQGTPRARVTPDQIGRYLVRLRATDVHGAFGEADVELLPRDLTVVLTWAASGGAACRAFSEAQCAAFSAAERAQRCCNQSDLDLHLVAPDGFLGDYDACPATCEDPAFCSELSDAHVDTCRSGGLDACFANRSPEWGIPGRTDDPRLDVDDVRGLGPEVISLNDPADGTYRVVVHYCLDRHTEPTVATVQIFDQERQIGSVGPQTINENQAWSAAVLVRSNGTWNVVAAPGLFEANVPLDLCGG